MRPRRRRMPPAILILITICAATLFYIVDNDMDRSLLTVLSHAGRANAASTPTVSAPASASLSTSVPLATPESVDAMRLIIPKAAVNATIVETHIREGTWDVSYLGSNIGHLEGTAWPDEGGNTVLAGHLEMRDGGMGVFAFLKELVPGDVIIVQHRAQSYRYTVSEIRLTTPDDLTPVQATDHERLTLITCDNYSFLQNAYLERLIIVAEA